MSHLSDRVLVQFLDGELTDDSVRGHLNWCEVCRERSEQLASAGAEFEKQYRTLQAPASRGALVLPVAKSNWWWVGAAAALVGATLIIRTGSMAQRPIEEPEPFLTPGATHMISRAAVCASDGDRELRRVASDVAERVFERYGIASPKPRMYEIDYLIPPDLGGSEDPRNLWPQPYGRVWNARVKDALEEHLRALVCDGKIDLQTAQRDLARDWIGAYKRYFRTDAPRVEHAAFYKDRPWE